MLSTNETPVEEVAAQWSHTLHCLHCARSLLDDEHLIRVVVVASSLIGGDRRRGHGHHYQTTLVDRSPSGIKRKQQQQRPLPTRLARRRSVASLVEKPTRQRQLLSQQGRHNNN